MYIVKQTLTTCSVLTIGDTYIDNDPIISLKYRTCSLCGGHRAARRSGLGAVRLGRSPAHDNRLVSWPPVLPVRPAGRRPRAASAGRGRLRLTSYRWHAVWSIHRYGKRIGMARVSSRCRFLGRLCPIPLPFWLSNAVRLNSGY